MVICRDGHCQFVNADELVKVEQNQESRLKAFTISAAGGIQSKAKVIERNAMPASMHNLDSVHLPGTIKGNICLFCIRILY